MKKTNENSQNFLLALIFQDLEQIGPFGLIHGLNRWMLVVSGEWTMRKHEKSKITLKTNNSVTCALKNSYVNFPAWFREVG